jgi:DNA-binding transcriptional ArsR family regulator
MSKKIKLTEEDCVRVAEFFKALSNPLRVKIICSLMDKEKCVGDILEEVPAKQANLSQQLGFLYMMRILKRRKVGKHVYYALKDQKTRDFFLTVQKLVLS